MLLHGRCISISKDQLILLTSNGTRLNHPFAGPLPPIKIGDLLKIRSEDGQITLQTPNRCGRWEWTNRVQNPRRIHAMDLREKIEREIRNFFQDQGFREVRTPLLVPCPGMEPHIRPFQIQGGKFFLPTSPEFAMKRLLVGGLEKIYQLCPAFRDEPVSVTHFPEFTMLEWYRAYMGYEEIMQDTEELFHTLAQKIFGQSWVSFQGRQISLAPPWPRLKVRDLFLEKVGIDLTRSTTKQAMAEECKRLGLSADLNRETWDDLYFKIWLNCIEPTLPDNQAVFVYRYPTSQAALSVIDQDPDGTSWARRFEVYAGGLELGNAFEELTDPSEQRKRFEEDMDLREETYGADFLKNPLDEGFLGALEEGMPPAGGIAVGVDRLVMLFADEADIDYCFWLRNEPIPSK